MFVNIFVWGYFTKQLHSVNWFKMGHVVESYNSVSAEYVMICYGLFSSYLI